MRLRQRAELRPSSARRTSPTFRRPTRGRPVLTALSENRYLTLSLLLLALMLSHAVKQKWGSATDVWEHIAAARELAAHPFDPQHPMLPVDAPHQFFTPYTLFVAMMMRITGWHVLVAFGTVGILNLGLFLFGLHRFVRALGGGTDVAFYTLLFTLFLWGSDAWFYSGFLHFNVIAHVLSYPSTFALGLTLLVFTVQARYLENGDPRLLMGIIAAGVVVLLSHPITFIFFAIGCLSLIGLRSTRRRDALVATLLALMAVGALALIWPYFSIYDLLFGGSPMVEGAYREAVATANHELYNQVLHRILPALLVVPFVVSRLRDWRRDPLALMAAGLAAVYGLGWAYDVGSSGRSLSFLLLVGVMILAQELVKAQHALAELGSSVSPVRRWIRATVALFVLIGMFNLRNGFEVLPDRFVADIPYEWIHNEVGFTRFEDFQFVEHNHARYRVVLSDLYTSLEVAAFGSRTVAFARAQPFVDTRARSADLDRFFAEDTSETERRAILDRYRVGLLILTREHLEAEPDVYEPMLDQGREVAANDRFVFVDVRSAPGR